MSMNYRFSKKKKGFFDKNEDTRIRVASVIIAIISCILIVRLFMIMVLQHDFYSALAAGSQEIYSQLIPERGDIYVQDSRTGETYPVALNRDVFLMYVDTRDITSDEAAEHVAAELAETLGYDDEKKFALYLQINKRTDPYEPIEAVLPEEKMEQIREKKLEGIRFIRKPQRFYPESALAAHVIGFLGKDKEGNNVGNYGIEGYFDQELSGTGGFLEGARSASGGWIPLAGRLFKPAENGVDIMLTLDRTIQYKACEMLRAAAEVYKAEGAALVVMNPNTGAILAMCSYPDFNPNSYSKVENIQVYNNTSIFTPYEIGSVFKPIPMAAAINEELVGPDSPFYDPGVRTDICSTPVRNADSKIYKDTTMTGVLENSINTGMVHIAERLGKNKFLEYIVNFGFGVKTGISLDTEVSGNIDTLYVNKGNSIDCYAATAAFGQGITATPLQMVSAYSAIANGGKLLKPYIVEEIQYANNKVEKTRPKEVKQVISKRASSLVSGMLVRVVDAGHATGAGVEGHYVAGKTGTAQIAGQGGYIDATNHSFVGFAPVNDPKFVMLVKFEKPQVRFSSSTAAPTFGKIAKFILNYYQVAPVR